MFEWRFCWGLYLCMRECERVNWVSVCLWEKKRRGWYFHLIKICLNRNPRIQCEVLGQAASCCVAYCKKGSSAWAGEMHFAFSVQLAPQCPPPFWTKHWHWSLLKTVPQYNVITWLCCWRRLLCCTHFRAFWAEDSCVCLCQVFLLFSILVWKYAVV